MFNLSNVLLYFIFSSSAMGHLSTGLHPDFPRNPTNARWHQGHPDGAEQPLQRRGRIEVTMESAAFYVDFIWETDSTMNQRII